MFMTLRGDESPQQPAPVAKVLTLKADVIWRQITKRLKAPLAGAFFMTSSKCSGRIYIPIATPRPFVEVAKRRAL